MFFRNEEKITTDKCVPSIISTCLNSYNDTVVIDKCQNEPMGIITEGVTSYRNIYCALCNGIDYNNLKCQLHPGN